MTCKEKIYKIEKILDDKHGDKIERIREVVEDEEDKEIALKEIKQAREEISEMRKEHNVSVTDCLDVLDKLIES